MLRKACKYPSLRRRVENESCVASARRYESLHKRKSPDRSSARIGARHHAPGLLEFDSVGLRRVALEFGIPGANSRAKVFRCGNQRRLDRLRRRWRLLEFEWQHHAGARGRSPDSRWKL